MKIAMLMPSKGRAAQLKARVNDLLLQSIPGGIELIIVLAIVEGDEATKQAANELIDMWYESDVTIVKVMRPETSTAVDGWNRAYTAVADLCDWFVLAADDIVWGVGWLGAVMGLIATRPHVQVIGLNDGHTDLNHYAPHYMARADFCKGILGGHIAPSDYVSWWFDREICELAQNMGVYIPGWHVHAEHKHPDWQTAIIDDTYNEAKPSHEKDRRLYQSRLREIV